MKESPFAYNLMVTSYRIEDLFHKPGKQLYDFGIREGDTVVDYGCGPGRYLQTASALVGSSGLVYAADVNLIAMEHLKKRITKAGLNNIIPFLINDGTSGIPGGCADVVYALDMFHQVADPAAFFEEIHRIIKSSGALYLEDGHQSRDMTQKKIQASGLWEITREESSYIALKPLIN